MSFGVERKEVHKFGDNRRPMMKKLGGGQQEEWEKSFTTDGRYSNLKQFLSPFALPLPFPYDELRYHLH